MSVRLRLTLWNVCVLALMLAGLGAALRWTLQASLTASADRALQGMAHRMQEDASFPPPPGPPPPGPPPFRGTRPSEDQNGPFGSLHPQEWNTRGRPWNFGPHGPPGGPSALSSPAASAPYDRRLFLLSRAGAENFATESLDGQPVRLLSVPLRRGGLIIGVAQIPYSLTEISAEIRHLTEVLLLLAGPALIIAGLGGAYLTYQALRPVRRITQTAGRIQAEDLSRRLPVAGRDELSDLSATLNGMLVRLEEAFRQRAAAYAKMEQAYARLEAANEQQRRFIADASHELKTPLTVIAGTVSLSLSGQRTADQYRQALETVERSAAMMTRIVQDLLLLARSDAGQLLPDRRPVSVADVLALACESVSVPDGLCIPVCADPSLTVQGDPHHLVRLFVNLLDNAVRHTPADGRITVTATAEKGFVAVTVEDTGSGIAPEYLPHLFERFYRVDMARARRHGGTGLGLAICRSIAEAHGGTLTLTSTLGEGTRAEVRLPI